MNKKRIIIIIAAVIIIAAIVYFFFLRKKSVEAPVTEVVTDPATGEATAQTWLAESFPLNKGMKGENVKRLQMAINRIGGTLQTITTKVIEDGKFGEGTKTKLLLTVPTSQSTLPMSEATFNAIIAKANNV